MEKLTAAQKAAETRRRNAAMRWEREQNRRRVVAGLEAIIQDEQSSREAKEAAVMLLASDRYKSGWY